MTSPVEHDEESLGRLLAALPPAPQDWVEAAASLPGIRRDTDRIVALAEADQEFREAAVADLEAALKLQGYEPNLQLLAKVRARLQERGALE